jgi:uncharacterized protein YecT (DUF1311 family)
VFKNEITEKMKYILTIFAILAVSGQICFAQWSEDELKPYKQKADMKVKAYVDQMIQSGKWDREYDELKIGFVSDTMRIETIVRLMEDDGRYSTMDMHNAISFQMTEYDKLLNKYYKLLRDKLSDDDKVKLRDAQRVWLKYRDSEAAINGGIIAPNEYTGGGTMWPVLAGLRTLAIVKERVCSLYEFITYI